MHLQLFYYIKLLIFIAIIKTNNIFAFCLVFIAHEQLSHFTLYNDTFKNINQALQTHHIYDLPAFYDFKI